MERIGFIGLGVMGLPMAQNLARKLARTGHALKVWNRTPARCADIPEAEAVVCPAGLADRDVVFVNVSDDAAVEAVLFGPGQIGGSGGATRGDRHRTVLVHPIRDGSRSHRAEARGTQLRGRSRRSRVGA